MKHFTAEIAPDTKYHITADAVVCGSDINVSICGGEGHHIGAVSIAVYEPVRDSATVSTVTVHTHRDDVVAAMCAKELSKRLKCTVTVSAGIHIDDASPEELSLLQENTMACLQELIKAILA